MSKLKIYFMRHGITENNIKGRLCGRYDALLAEEGREALKKLTAEYEYPKVEKVYVSPAIRCKETAALMFPGKEMHPVEGFWEFCFGEMENRLMEEFIETPMYDKWLASAPDFGFPGGETILEAKYRALAAMTRVVKDCMDNGLTEVAIVAHGEIFALLTQAALVTDEPMEAFLLCPNGMGFVAELDPEVWFFKEQKMQFTGFFPPGAPRPKAEDSPYFRKREPEEKPEN